MIDQLAGDVAKLVKNHNDLVRKGVEEKFLPPFSKLSPWHAVTNIISASTTALEAQDEFLEDSLEHKRKKVRSNP